MGNNDIAKSYLDLLVQLMMAGMAEQALEVVGEWSATADPSLVRHFVWQVSSCCDSHDCHCSCL